MRRVTLLQINLGFSPPMRVADLSRSLRAPFPPGVPHFSPLLREVGFHGCQSPGLLISPASARTSSGRARLPVVPNRPQKKSNRASVPKPLMWDSRPRLSSGQSPVRFVPWITTKEAAPSLRFCKGGYHELFLWVHQSRPSRSANHIKAMCLRWWRPSVENRDEWGSLSRGGTKVA